MTTAVRPLQPSPFAQPAATAPSDPFSLTPEQKASIRVLIVDDDRTLREGCATALQIEGYNVTTSGRGDEAIDLP